MAQAQDAVWLPVLPSMKDFGPALIKGAGSEADKSGKSVGKRFGTAIVAGTAAAVTGVVAAGTALYKVGEVFDDVTDTIRTGTGATGKSLDGLVDVAKKVGSTVPAEFSQIGTVVADVNTRMGLSGKTLEAVASQYLEAGRVLGEEVDIGKTSAAFNAFKIEGEDVSGALDHLFQVSQATGLGMNELADAAARNAPAMQTLGFSFEETTAMVGSFDKAGLNTSQVMASMSKGLVTLAKDGEQPAEAFKRVQGEIGGFLEKGDEAGALNLASKVFGTRGATQFIGALKSGTLNLDDMSKAAGQTGDTILGVGQDTADFAEQWQLFKNRVLVWLEPLGTKVFGALGSAMDEVNKAVTAFGAAWEYNDGEITSSGLPGFFERLGYLARQAFDYFQTTVLPVLKDMGAWLLRNKDWLLALAGAVLAGVAAYKAFMIVQTIIGFMRTYATVTQLAALGQKALNLAMSLNPIGIVVALIAGLVAAIVWLYNNNETARNIINAAWTGIQNAVKFAWEKVIKPTFDWISNFVKNVLAPAFTWFWNTIIKPVWGFISSAIKVAWGIIETIFLAIKWYINNVLGPVFKWIYQNIIKPVWDNISKTIKDVWEKKVKPVFDALGAFIKDKVAPAFSKGVQAIKDIWGTVMDIARKPINFIIGTVYNNGLRKALNSVREIVGGDPLPELPLVGAPGGNKGVAVKGGPMRAFAKGGFAAPGWALVGEEGPELVNFSRPGRVYTAKQSREMLATDVQSRGRLPMGAASVWDGIKNAASSALAWARGGLADAAGLILNPIKDGIAGTLASMFGRTVLGDVASGLVRSTVDNALKWIRGKDAADSAAGLATYNGPRGLFTRPSHGPFTSMFGPRPAFGDFHTGVDIAGGGPTYAALNGVVSRIGYDPIGGHWIRLNHGGGFGTYYGHNPASGIKVKQGQKVKAGQRIGMQGMTGLATGVHLHFQTEQNGRPVNPMAYLHDNGGVLQPGLSTILNNTRKPEAILNGQQWADIHSLAKRNAGGAGTQVTIEGNVGWMPDELVRQMDKQARRAQTVAGMNGVVFA